MFKLNKESQRTFYGLLAVPIFWIVLNHLGFLDYLKIKTLDWRMNWPRGEISHRTATDADDKVTVENNQSVPRVPKVMYVNFDGGTLGMDEVGERPWDRAFFRDVSQILFERGKARVVAFDFVFSSKSMSSMVPEENVYRSDAAIGELIANFPNQVVLGATFSKVQTSLMKPYGQFAGVKATIPLFKDGYQSLNGDYRYPEAPTYPIQSYAQDIRG